MKYAEELLREEQADPYVVIPAAALLDAGNKAAEAKHPGQEGAAAAGKVLINMDYDEDSTYEVCAIIAHLRTPGPQETATFKVVYDADRLAALQDEMKSPGHEKMRAVNGRTFLTESGKRTAEKLFSQG
jgi:hypothetical protein